MLLDGRGVDEYVVQVNMDESCDKVAEHRGHQPLECQGGIAVPLLHHSAHECAEDGGECRLWDVLIAYTYLLVHFRHVQLGPVCGMRYVVPNGILVQKGTDVLFRILVLHTQIEYSAQLPILFENAKHQHGLPYGRRDPPPHDSVPADFFS